MECTTESECVHPHSISAVNVTRKAFIMINLGLYFGLVAPGQQDKVS